MRANLDKKTYKLLLQFKQHSMDSGKLGKNRDLDFLQDDLWLQDAAVFDRVVRINGSWQVFLVFVHYRNPLLLIKRFIKSQISRQKAKVDAVYMKRLAAKDQRGTLHVNPELYKICKN